MKNRWPPVVAYGLWLMFCVAVVAATAVGDPSHAGILAMMLALLTIVPTIMVLVMLDPL